MPHKLQKSVFLDRDGIINIDTGYVYKIEDFQFTQNIFELLKLFIKHKYLLFIVTNQSGIGRGYYSEEDFKQLNQWMLNRFSQENITIQQVVYCPHIPEILCQCRKPEIGMIKELLNHSLIDLENSWMIGDKQSDIDFAKNTGIEKSIAIGDRKIADSTYAFDSITACYNYLEKNQNKIL